MVASPLRLDQALVARALVPTRSRARDAIKRGCVRVDGKPVGKPGALIAERASVEVSDPVGGYVSRAALKLKSGLELSGYDATGCEALDLGASTGGFTQVLLDEGASRVTALDVGHGQLASVLRDDARVCVLERFNARDLTLDDLPARPDFIVSDVSFISLMIAATPALELAAPGARAILLVKPQFEVGREHVGKGGIVSNEGAVADMLARIRDWFGTLQSWRIDAMAPSPIAGSDGNQEFLLCGRKDD